MVVSLEQSAKIFACGPAAMATTSSLASLKSGTVKTFLVPPYPDGPGKEVVKWVSVCLSVLLHSFLANVNSRSRLLYAIARPSVVCLSVACNACAPYSGGSKFPQNFYGIRYLGHPLTSTESFTEIVPGEPLHGGS